jgi:integrase/recombinase XerC
MEAWWRRVQGWLTQLQDGDRRSALTVRNYAVDLADFGRFMGNHAGQGLTLTALAAHSLSDWRSWLAAMAQHRPAAASRNRALAALRQWVGWFARQQILPADAPVLRVVQQVRNLKQPAHLPKALEVEAMKRLLTLAASDFAAQQPWQAKRRCAMLLLLYGAGLRISEALAITLATWRQASGGMITITGKGDKQRLVPLLPIVQQAVEAYLASDPRPAAAMTWSFWANGGGLGARAGAGGIGTVAPRPQPARLCDPTRPAPQLCHPFVGGGQRPARDSGIVGAQQPNDHRTLYQGRCRQPASADPHHPPPLVGVGVNDARPPAKVLT